MSGPIGLAPGASEDAAGQDAKKYSTSNPVVLRLIDRWLTTLRSQLGPADGVVVDVGIGEGLAAERLGLGAGAGAALVGVEYRLDKVLLATGRLPGLAGVRADAGMLPVKDGAAGLVTCIEVLEHLVRPDAAIAELARITGGKCVVSVPWEPWFRLGNLGRGKNVGRLGNDPEHVQQFTPARLRRALERDFAHVEVVRCFPWLIGVARTPGRRGSPPQQAKPAASTR
jgi:SAM-dependent methyltransferase